MAKKENKKLTKDQAVKKIETLKKDSHSPKGLEDMDGYDDLIDTIETLRAEISILKGE